MWRTPTATTEAGGDRGAGSNRADRDEQVSRMRDWAEAFIPVRVRYPTMRFTHDRRGQSVVIGTVILFGFLILALASYQAFAVPAQNNEAEFDHSQDLQSDMEDLRASVLDVRDAEQNPYQRPVRLNLGIRYDSRLFTVNPPPPEGALTTQDRGPIEVRNATVNPAVEDQFENTEPLFNTSHETRLLTFRPGYNEYRNPPRTTFEHSLLYNRFEGENQTVTGQRTIDGDDNRVFLVAYTGDVNRQGLSTTLDPETLDGQTPVVPITSNGGPLEVELPTHSPSLWEDLLSEEPNVTVTDSTSTSVVVELEGEWNLQMARVGYDGGSVGPTPFSNVTRLNDPSSPTGNGTDSVFLTEWETDSTTVPEGSSEPLNVTVTDRLSGEFIRNSTIDYSIAYNATSNNGTASLNKTNETIHSGTDTVLFQSGSAEQGDVFDVYASAGDNVDRTIIKIGDGGQADSVQSVGGTTTSGGSGKFSFDITAGSTVEINAAAVETTGSIDSLGVGNPGEFTIDTETSTKGNSADGSFDYEFSPSVLLDPSDGDTEIAFNKLDSGIKNVDLVDDETNADLIVSIRFSDGNIKRFYLEADKK